MRRLLIANRGEIAARIARTASSLGYETVAVTSGDDRRAPFVRLVDLVVEVESYLLIEGILEAARKSNADAVHPGYGFLAENASFARASADAGIVFVGPSPETIALMADKGAARASMEAAGVPCVPGSPPAKEVSDLRSYAEQIGFPLLVKATAGGGGRGLRRVDRLADLEPAAAAALRETGSSFGESDLFLERLLDGVRHVEAQIVADQQGQCVVLGERDCSLQRRHQKVVEEAPCAALDAVQRRRLLELAVLAAATAHYVGVGTVEFLMTPAGDLYFLEMNTRLQVEHPVTEWVTGVDLVEWQLRIAEGEAIPFVAMPPEVKGHAIEARLCAEDPIASFRPETGRLIDWLPAGAPGIRVDDALSAGSVVGPQYDPMLAKVISWGPDREAARRRLMRALEQTVVFGVKTNRHLLTRVVGHADFASASVTTDWLERQDLEAMMAVEDAVERRRRSLALAAQLWVARAPGEGALAPCLSVPWVASVVSECSEIGAGPENAEVEVRYLARDRSEVRVDDRVYETVVVSIEHGRALITLEGVGHRVAYASPTVPRCGEPTVVHLLWGGLVWKVAPWRRQTVRDDDQSSRTLAPMAARVVSVSVASGDRVEKGAELVILEAMKLETRLLAPRSGTVASVLVAVGDQVDFGAPLVTWSEAAGDPNVEATQRKE